MKIFRILEKVCNRFRGKRWNPGMRILIRLLIVASCLALSASVSSAQEYVITDLGTLGGETSEAAAINATGQVAGTADTATPGQYRAFLWELGVLFDLGALDPDGRSRALAINDSGSVAGSSQKVSGLWHATRFGVGLLPLQVGADINILGESSATGINPSGDLCGWRSDNFDNLSQTFFTVPFVVNSGVYRGLPGLGGLSGQALGINASGRTVGRSQIAANAAYNGFLDIPGVAFVNAGTLGGTNARVNAINAAGDYVGYSDVVGSVFHQAFIYRATAGTMTRLGTLARSSEAMALNSQRTAVGYSFDDSGVSRAVRFANGGIADLNRLIKPGTGWLLTVANGINDSGWIVGTGTNSAGKTRGFLLQPDTAPPSIRFGVKGVVRTAEARFTVKGTARDNVFIKRIEYQVGGGRFKTARGGTNWKATTALRPGGNRITVRAIDGAGNVSRSTTLSVIRS